MLEEEKFKKCFIKNIEYKCRTCFEPSGVIHELDWVFEEFIKDTIKLKDPPDDRLPNTMCSCCLDKLTTSVTFIAQVKLINENFLKLLTESEENNLKQADFNADCLQEHTIDIPLDGISVQHIKLEEVDEFNLVNITEKIDNDSEDDKLSNLADNNVIEIEGKTPSVILKLNKPQGKQSEDVTNDDSLKKEILKGQIQESDEDDNDDTFVDNGEGCESSSDDESVPKKKRKIENKSSPKNLKRPVGRPATNSFDKIKKVNGRFACLLCEKSFSYRKDCVRHISSVHLKDNKFSCEFCGNNFSRKDKLREHIKRMHSAESSMREQQQRKRKQHELYGDRLYSKPSKPWHLIQCKLCNKSAFKNSRELRSHLKLHKNKDTLLHIDEHSEIVKLFFANNLNLDNIKDMICNDLTEQKFHKYYNIINDFSWEMSISDTEPEDLAEFVAPYDSRLKYECELCGKQFQFKFAAFEHQKTHAADEDDMPFKCGLCKLEFVSSKMFDSHCQSHCRNKHKVLLCTNCPAKFAWSENMEKHKCALEKSENVQKKQLLKQKTVGSGTCKPTSTKIIQCALCCNSFETLRLLRLHLPIHADGRTAIDLKNSSYIKRFERSKNLDLTLLQHQIQYNFKRQQISRYYRALAKDGNEMDILDSETDDETESDETMIKYICTLCSTPAEFKRRKNLLAHQHEKHNTAPLPFKCDDCAKEFISNCLLQQHLQRECANEFRKQAQQCEYCEKRLIWPNNMLKHKEIQHKHKKQPQQQKASNTLKCDYCDKTFIWPRDLVRHRKIHIDGKNFSCPHCERKFQRKDSLLSHLRIHDSQIATNNANSTTASNSSNRTTDQILPHLVKPNGCKIIKCMICNTEHNKICDLRSHLKSHQIEIDLARRTQDNEQISDISKQFYPDELPILAEEELQKKILHDIRCDNKIERFYSITNEHGYEIHLDSSETDSDSEDETESKEINQKNNFKRIYNCENCADVTFNRKYKLYDHQLKMHRWEEARHFCFHCNARFLSSTLLQLHYKRQCNNTMKKFFCKQCPLRFMWKSNLQAHTTMDHATKLGKENEPQLSFECLLCERKYFHQRDLTRHTSIVHQSINSYAELRYCLLCPITFYNSQHLNEHLLDFHQLTESDIKQVEFLLHSSCWPNGEKKIECKICRMKFRTMLELRQHQSIPENMCHTLQHSIRNYSIVNKKGFELNLELDSETDNDDQEDELGNTKPYLCRLCSWSCSRKYQMMQHQRSFHDYDEILQWKCENCLFSSVCEKILDYHKQTQCFNLDKELQCPHCNLKFMWHENLESHIFILHAPSSSYNTATQHSSTKHNIFECMECHRQYNRKDRYRAHFKKFHIITDKARLNQKQIKSELKQPSKKEEKILLCAFCGLSFRNNSNLTVHLRRHTGERPYKCDLCEMGFPRSSDLQDHRRSHTGEKPYKCSSCDKSFSRQYKLQVHNRIHTGERPYHCTFCERTFIQSNDLSLHLRRHTGERPYLCGTCGEGFICSAALKQHQNSKGHLTGATQDEDSSVNITHYQSSLDCEYSSQY